MWHHLLEDQQLDHEQALFLQLLVALFHYFLTISFLLLVDMTNRGPSLKHQSYAILI